jgi:hypothetical protein
MPKSIEIEGLKAVWRYTIAFNEEQLSTRNQPGDVFLEPELLVDPQEQPRRSARRVVRWSFMQAGVEIC